MSKHKLRVVVADDHAILRSGLKLLLEGCLTIEVVGEASDGHQALAILESTAADVLVLDLSMPNMDGLECIREIKSRNLAIRIVVLTMHEDEDYVKEALQAGAMGYVQKGAVDTELFAAIKDVHSGKLHLSPSHTQSLLTTFLSGPASLTEDDDPYTILSARERQVLKLLVRGHSASEVAQILSLSVKTVDTYKSRIMEKLQLDKKSQLVSYALKHGLLS